MLTARVTTLPDANESEVRTYANPATIRMTATVRALIIRLCATQFPPHLKVPPTQGPLTEHSSAHKRPDSCSFPQTELSNPKFTVEGCPRASISTCRRAVIHVESHSIHLE